MSPTEAIHARAKQAWGCAHLLLRERQPAASGHRQLQRHEVEAVDGLRHGVLHLA